ncbi:hypothetical protein [Vibrio sp. 10N.286.46.E10]|uniref:hypothetical protein n=1 Tax=Vibrio sp. 10N.286.46.E10 TaxID=1884477 RepID=UPI000D343E5F|nr:hypothetical protein [Vibrio sp. 10N.286.46.E10]PTQ14398.1 hypothetical protein CWO24_24550 [Vibrio sp. 10N.286.46.E10]
MSEELVEGSSFDKVIILLEKLPLEQVIALKSHVDLLLSDPTHLPNTLSEEESLFIANLYKEK